MGLVVTNYLESELKRVASIACDYAFANASEDLKTLRGGRSCFYPIVDVDNKEV